MVLPVIQHQLTKIGKANRRRLVKSAFLFSAIACFTNTIGVCTNNWLHTSEVLRYYVPENRTDEDDTTQVFFKNATLGPWLFCWLDPITEFHCNKTDLFVIDDPADVTTAVEQSVKRSYMFMAAGFALNVLSFLATMFCLIRENPYRTLFVATITNIFTGLANFACIIVFMSAVSKEVGNKIYKASEIDDKLFHYRYGFSFILFKASFLCTETAALLSVIVYMSKRDERTYNRYRIRSILKTLHDAPVVESTDPLVVNERYHRHTRMNTLRRHSRFSNISIDDELPNRLKRMDSYTKPKGKFLVPPGQDEEPKAEQNGSLNDHDAPIWVSKSTADPINIPLPFPIDYSYHLQRDGVFAADSGYV